MDKNIKARPAKPRARFSNGKWTVADGQLTASSTRSAADAIDAFVKVKQVEQAYKDIGARA